MWKLLFYVKSDQGSRETYFSTDQVFLPILAVKPELGEQLAEVGVQYKRHTEVHKRRLARGQNAPGKTRPWVKVDETYFKGTRRFQLSDPVTAAGIAQSPDLAVSDMARPCAIEDFTRWGLGLEPASGPVCLMLWSHGAAWKSPLVSPLHVMSRRLAKGDEQRSETIHTLPDLRRGLAAGAQGRKIDVLGLHSCFMACIEAAYELRDLADIMIGSEEETPFLAWRHREWMSALATRERKTSPEELARMIVMTYEMNEFPATTFSAVRLGPGVASLTKGIGQFVDVALGSDAATWATLAAVRQHIREYGRFEEPIDVLTVDIVHFFEAVASGMPNTAIGDAARVVARECRDVVIEARSGRERRRGYGSHGLSIFFPRTKQEFGRLDYAERYDPDSPDCGEFVRASGWRRFLDAYWRHAPAS